VLRWFDGHGFTLWEAVHDGYGRLPHPVLHRRIVLWLRDRYGIVCDVLEGEGSHQAVVRFHAAIGATMAPLDASVAVIGEDGPMLRMIADRDLFVEPAWTSAMYGSRARTQVAKLDWSVSGGSDATVTVLIPETSADGPASCQRVAGAGAIA